MGPSRRAVLLVLAGTSGAGKTTLRHRCLERHPEVVWSVSWTTRSPRQGEREGADYHFVSRPEFERLRDAGGFLEWFEVYGDLKGTPREFVDEQLAAGRDVMLEVDVQGALAIKREMPGALLVFVKAPSRDEQRRRLETRGADDPEAIERRLAQAEAEERLARREFDAVVVNDDLDRAAREISSILESRRNPPR